MTAPIGSSDAAARQFHVVVETRAPPVGRRALRWFAATLASFLFGVFDGLTDHRVVVRDRSTGQELMRFDATDSEEINVLVDRLEEDLERLTVDAFCEEWHVDKAA